MSRPRILIVAVFALKAWDTAPRGKPATGLMTEWLKKARWKA